jgi:hypothetical protein
MSLILPFSYLLTRIYIILINKNENRDASHEKNGLTNCAFFPEGHKHYNL